MASPAAAAHGGADARYALVWQVWVPRAAPAESPPHAGGDLAVASARAHAADADAACGVGCTGQARASANETWRRRVQVARIQARMPVSALADAVGCDAETLAAFERGDALLAGDVHGRLCRVLALERPAAPP